MPTPRTEAYLFVHFIGEERTPTDEQLVRGIELLGQLAKDVL